LDNGGFCFKGGKMLTLTVEEAQSLKQFTENHYAQAAFFWTYLLKNKEIKVNGRKVCADVALSAGDEVSYFLTSKQQGKKAFSIAYQDELVLVADKESGVNSEAVYEAIKREREIYFIHRLDRNTQGLLLFAKTPTCADALLKAFKERKIEKIYHALCVGRLNAPAQTLTAYLKKDEKTATVKIFDRPQDGADKIITEYKTLWDKQGISKLEIRLHTGKTHQIRAHFAHIGNPVLGDMKYGDKEVNKRLNRTRQCLVAKSLTLSLPDFPTLDKKTFLSSFNAELTE